MTAEAYPLPSVEELMELVRAYGDAKVRSVAAAHSDAFRQAYSKTHAIEAAIRSYAERLAVDARRYQWLRNRLAIEDIERLERDYLGSHDESESVKCDREVDAALSKKGATHA